MIFSRFSRSLPRSSLSVHFFNVGGRLAKKNVDEALVRLSGVDSYLGRIDGGGLGFLRSYFASIGVHSKFVSKTSLSDLKYILPNPNLRRLFSTEPPNKKNCENYCPEENKEIPTEEEKKTESIDYSSTDDQGNFEEAFFSEFKLFWTILIIIVFYLSMYFTLANHDHVQISFQEFKNKLLEPGLVDHIVISNESVAKVFVRSSPLNQRNDIGVLRASPMGDALNQQYDYYLDVGSNIEHFKEKLENAQQALNIDPNDYVPVTYVYVRVWHLALMGFAHILWLLGGYYLFRRGQGGLGELGGGCGGRGGRGISNIGKAHIMKVDKNSKNKKSGEISGNVS